MLAKFDGVLYGQKLANPALIRIDLNILCGIIMVPHDAAFRHRQCLLLVAVASGARMEFDRFGQLHRLPVDSCP